MTDSASDGMDDFMEELNKLRANADKAKRREKEIKERPSEDALREGLILLTVEVAVGLLESVAEGLPNVTEAQAAWLEAMAIQVKHDALSGEWDL